MPKPNLPRTFLAVCAAIITVFIGYLGYLQYSASGAQPVYADKNINFGASDGTGAVCPSTAPHARLVCLADQLKATVSSEILAKLQRPYSVQEAKLWSNFPPMGFSDRVGPSLGDFTPEQRMIIKALLTEAMSVTANEGIDELVQILNADDYLIENTGQTGFSSSNYHLAFLGTPSATGIWQLYFGGHHFALSQTFKDGELVGATPAFRGVEPFVPFDQNDMHNIPMQQEQAAFAAILSALSPEDLATAKLTTAQNDIIAGPQNDGAFPTTSEGLRLKASPQAVKDLVLAAVETYLGDVSPALSQQFMEKYRAEINETYLSYAGSGSMANSGDYMRIDGPSVWIEFSIQPGRSIEGVHPHSVWRDKVADYGGN